MTLVATDAARAAAPRRALTPTEVRLWAAVALIAVTALPPLFGLVLDDRRFQGDPIWLKPVKFHLAVAVYLATLAVLARWLPAGFERARGWRVFLGLALAAAGLELVWIDGAAALGVASHFNVGTPLLQALYGAMGLVASVLTALTLVMGLAIWRNRAVLTPALRDGLGLGLVLTFGLTMVAAWGMAAGPGHLVGVPASGARVPLMGWSREVGDLRFAHFLATHALHVVPLAGLTGARAAVWLAGGAYAGLVLWAFARALSGLPLLV